ncbi:MAG TPA: trehalose-6-phosphate synthase [Rhodocyclaceae bacterium]|nr:trehalose-6-phosphate synthase [Rhodocyclaceae bacterium]
MRLSLRFVLPLMLVLVGFAYSVTPLVDRLTLSWFVRDTESRAMLVAHTIQEPLLEQLSAGRRAYILEFFSRITQDERLYAMGYCPSPNSAALATASLPPEIHCDNLAAWEKRPGDHLLSSNRGLLQITVAPMESAESPQGRLVLVHDMSFVQRRSRETQRYVFYFFTGLALAVALITVIIAQLSWRGWVTGIRALLRGEGLVRQPVMRSLPIAEFGPVAKDLKQLIRNLELEHRVRNESLVTWTPDRLRTILHTELRGEQVIVVSNREPYIHQLRGTHIEVQRPASGLVTALEPIMRACSGTWIATGSGSADRAVVDAKDRIAVPPGAPVYQLRRIWLTPEEEAGYYSGFANEGLWPLCHIAHVRPTFRSSDWACYKEINRRFAKAVMSEAKTEAPIVLVQDYHFALLPKMIRELMPEATIITFWHIPWPNPEAFAICPWREEVLGGLLGSSILGFHTQFHCNNFVDTVERLLEARVDREDFTVSLGGKLTSVQRYPISIAWPPDKEMVGKPLAQCRAEVREKYGLTPEQKIGVGVDRLDYTKGISERLRAVERLLEQNPDWIGRFTFIQIASPTRTDIEEYQHHEAQIHALVTRINGRFGRSGAPPIILKVEHHSPQAVYEHYRAAELCFVSSLHDGMNLVAKEFVASRDDEAGVLILSQFTGAARDLPEALIVNPYDTDQCATALLMALTMPLEEQQARMRLMRSLVREFNVYRWAGRMLLDAATMRRHGVAWKSP